MRSSPAPGRGPRDLGVVLAACGGTTSTASQPGASASEGKRREGHHSLVLLLGAGGACETQVPTEEAVVEAFNASHEHQPFSKSSTTTRPSTRCRCKWPAATPRTSSDLSASPDRRRFHGQWLDLTD